MGLGRASEGTHEPRRRQVGVLEEHGAGHVVTERRFYLMTGRRIEPATTRRPQGRLLFLRERRTQALLDSVLDAHRAVLLDSRDQVGEHGEAFLVAWQLRRAELTRGGA